MSLHMRRIAGINSRDILRTKGERTISSGAIKIEIDGGIYPINTELSASSDVLDTINGPDTANGNIPENTVVILRLADANHNVLITPGLGANGIQTPGTAVITLDNANDQVELRYNGTYWVASPATLSAVAVYSPARATGTISNAAVKTLNATPVEVIPAPGPGYYIDVISCHWMLDYGTVAFDSAAPGDTLNLKYTNGSGAAVVEPVAGDTIGAATADFHIRVRALPAVLPSQNAAIVAHIATGEWFSVVGDSTLKYDVLYLIQSYNL